MGLLAAAEPTMIIETPTTTTTTTTTITTTTAATTTTTTASANNITATLTKITIVQYSSAMALRYHGKLIAATENNHCNCGANAVRSLY